jgi:uncharacterized protein YfaS (alpha-2-macroglobulin family)
VVTVIVPETGDRSGTVVDVLLADSGSLAGTVTAADGGYPVAGAVMTLTDAQGVAATTGLTREDGGYSFTGLKDGEHTLAASAGGYRPATRQVIISDGEEVRADIQLAGYARLSGRVLTKAGAHPVPGARVTLLDPTGAAVAVAEADATGRYAFDSLADGEYTALASGFPPAASSLHITGPAGTVQHDIELKHTAC